MTPNRAVWIVRGRINPMGIWEALQLERGMKVGKYGTI